MRILLCGGGTEGHITPSLGLAEELTKSGDTFLFVTRKYGEENKKILQSKYPYMPIDIQSTASFRWYEKHLFFKGLYNAIQECKQIFKTFRPDAVFSTGGYVSLAPVLTAHKVGVPIYLHESNAIAGSATNLLLKYANTLFLGMPGCESNFKTAKRKIYTGTPLRETFFHTTKLQSRRKLGLSNEFMIVSFGGSLGAQKLNETCFEIMKEYSVKENIIHIHITGKRYYEDISNNKALISIFNRNYRAVSFVDNMEDYLCASDVVICRSGAATISEVLATGSYPLLVPSPNVKNNHQYQNAKAISNLCGIPLFEENEHLVSDLLSQIKYVRGHPVERRKKCQSIKSLSTPNSALQILEHIRSEQANM